MAPEYATLVGRYEFYITTGLPSFVITTRIELPLSFPVSVAAQQHGRNSLQGNPEDSVLKSWLTFATHMDPLFAGS